MIHIHGGYIATAEGLVRHLCVMSIFVRENYQTVLQKMSETVCGLQTFLLRHFAVPELLKDELLFHVQFCIIK